MRRMGKAANPAWPPPSVVTDTTPTWVILGDSVNVLGNLTLGSGVAGNSTLNINAISGFTVGTYPLIKMASFTNTGDVVIGTNNGPGAFNYQIVENANEIDLVQTGAGASGAVITLRKTKQFNGCTNDGLTGTFGLRANGVTTAAPTPGATPVSTPFNLSGRINADGQGFLVQDSVGLASPLMKRQFTGTYVVNLDCTGSATLIGADAKSRKIDFVIVNPGGPGGSRNNVRAIGRAINMPRH